MKKVIIILIAVFGTLSNAQISSELDEIAQYRLLLQNYRELAAEDSDAYMSDVLETLLHLAFLHNDREEFSEALPLLEEILVHTANGWAEGFNVEAIEGELASVIENIGDQHFDQKDFDTAEQYYLRSLKIFEKLTKDGSTSYLPDVSRLLSCIGFICHEHRKDYRTAEKYFMRGLQINEKLVMERPDNIIRQSNLSVNLKNIALNHYELKNYRKAEPYFRRSLQIREQLAKERPDKYLPQLATLLQDMGSNLLELKKYTEANYHYKRSLQISEQLTEEDLPSLARASGNLSWSYLFVKEYAQSETAARRALELDDAQTWVKVNLAHALLFQIVFRKRKKYTGNCRKPLKKTTKHLRQRYWTISRH